MKNNVIPFPKKRTWVDDEIHSMVGLLREIYAPAPEDMRLLAEAGEQDRSEPDGAA